MRSPLAIFVVLLLAFVTAAIPAAGSDAQDNHNPALQEFDGPAAAVAAGHGGPPVVNDAASGASAPLPGVSPVSAGPESAAKPSAPAQDAVSALKRILSLITPSKEDLEKAMDAIVAPKDVPAARPGPHWQASSSPRMRY